MNSVNLMGRLTSKPELRYTQSNVACCNFTLAVQRKFKNAMGEYEADFVNCVAFKTTAEIVNKYFDKGSLIGIDGRIQTRNYKNKHEETVYITEVIVDSRLRRLALMITRSLKARIHLLTLAITY